MSLTDNDAARDQPIDAMANPSDIRTWIHKGIYAGKHRVQVRRLPKLAAHDSRTDDVNEGRYTLFMSIYTHSRCVDLYRQIVGQYHRYPWYVHMGQHFVYIDSWVQNVFVLIILHVERIPGCTKDAPTTRTWSDGLFIINCGCPSKKMLAFCLMNEKESTRMAFEFIYGYFPVAPAFIMYVNGRAIRILYHIFRFACPEILALNSIVLIFCGFLHIHETSVQIR